jgi:hypothetical protein
MIQETIHRTCEAGGVDTVANYRITRGAEEHIARVLRNMYRNPQVAVAREYLCNAVDAHRLSGTNKFIVIRVPTQDDPVLRIRDYGPGLNKADSERLLFGFGASGDEKRASNGYIGGFGLGCKSAFAVAQQFTYTIWNSGRKRTWVCALDDKDVAKAFLLNDVASNDPTGIQVDIPTTNVSGFQDAVSSTVELWNDTYLGGFMKPQRDAARKDTYTPEGQIKLQTSIETQQGRCDIWWAKSQYGSSETTFVIGDDDVGLEYDSPWPTKHGGVMTVRVPIGTLDLTPSRDDVMETDRGAMIMKAVDAAVGVEIDKFCKNMMNAPDLGTWLSSLSAMKVIGIPNARKLTPKSYTNVTEWRGLPCDGESFYLASSDARYRVAMLQGNSILSARSTKARRRCHNSSRPIITVSLDGWSGGYVEFGAMQTSVTACDSHVPAPGLVVRVPSGTFATYGAGVTHVVNNAWHKAGHPRDKVWFPTGARTCERTWGWCVIVESDANVVETLPWTEGLPVWAPTLGKMKAVAETGPRKTSTLLYCCGNAQDWERRGNWTLTSPDDRKALLVGSDPIPYVKIEDGSVCRSIGYSGNIAAQALIGVPVYGIRALDLQYVRAHPKLGPRLKPAYDIALENANKELANAGITEPCTCYAEQGMYTGLREAAQRIGPGIMDSVPGFRQSTLGQALKLLKTHIVTHNDGKTANARDRLEQAMRVRRALADRVEYDGKARCSGDSAKVVNGLWDKVKKCSPILALVLEKSADFSAGATEMKLLLKQHVRDCNK